jgi:hypothetical protein
MDYSAKTAYKQNRALCFKLIDQLDEMLSWSGDPDFRDVGDVVEARNHLERAVKYLEHLGELKDDSKSASRTSRGSAGPAGSANRR